MAGTARKAAVLLLGEVLDGRQLLSQTDGMLSALAPADRARAQRLCAQTLRHLEQADRVLKPLLRLRVEHRRRDQLDRDLTIEQRVARAIDDTHATAAQLAGDFISIGESFPDHTG